ncbi:MAG: hypothetical protein ACYCV4_02465 [Dermatophilaceae bacterium]
MDDEERRVSFKHLGALGALMLDGHADGLRQLVDSWSDAECAGVLRLMIGVGDIETAAMAARAAMPSILGDDAVQLMRQTAITGEL